MASQMVASQTAASLMAASQTAASHGGKPDGKAKDWGKQLKGKGPLEGKATPAGAPAAAGPAVAKREQVDPPAEPRGVSPDKARALQEAVEARRSAEAAEAKMAAAAAEARKAAEAAEARMATDAAEARRAAEAAEAREAARHLSQAEVHTPRSASWQRAGGGYGGGQPLPPEEVEEGLQALRARLRCSAWAAAAPRRPQRGASPATGLRARPRHLARPSRGRGS